MYIALTLNLKGTQIRYGINAAGLNDKGITTEGEYKNGVTLNYFYDGTQTAGISSNIEDCLDTMAVIMQQAQSEHHAEALELLEDLYKSTHSYTTTESALYPCTHGCEITHYNCSEWKINWPSSELRFSPWLYAEVYKPTAEQECIVCKSGQKGEIPYDQYAGCTVTGTCYHSEDRDGNMGSSPDSGCDNYEAVYECPGHTHHETEADGSKSTYTDYCESELGCRGYYECLGHDHYGCPEGHDITACYGHVDLTMQVYIASLTRIFEFGGVSVTEEGAGAGTETAESTGGETGE